MSTFKIKPILKDSSIDASKLPYEFQTESSNINSEALIINSTEIAQEETTGGEPVFDVIDSENTEKVATGNDIYETNKSAVVNSENISSTNSTNNSTINDVAIENMLKGDFEVDLITKKIQDILKSPSPFTLYQKSTELKEDFANFINYIVKKIALGFGSQNQDVVMSMYHNAGYEKVWISNLKTYLDDLKYIDVHVYFQIILMLQKKQQYIAKMLIKIFKKEQKENIIAFRNKFCSEINLEDVYKKYELLGVESIRGDIESKNVDENKAYLFLYQIYSKQESTRDALFYLFGFELEEVTKKFDEIYNVFAIIAIHYLNDISYKDKQISIYIKSKKNILTIKALDKAIENYIENREEFYETIIGIVGPRSQTEKSYFCAYIKTQIINKYYPEVKRLFYWDKQVCSNRSEWANLRGSFVNSDKSQFSKEVKEILAFKKLIIELSTNTFSPFLKPFIYSIVSEKLSVTKKELLKIRYLMTLILSENYTEYKKIYNFFEDLETFMDYNIDDTLSRISFNFKKIKIFAADFIVGFFGLIWLYLYAPVGVFLGCLILTFSYLREHFTSFKSGIEWNLGIRTFATVILIISGFYWITNLDSTKLDVAKLSNKVEKIGLYRTDETIKIVNAKIENLKIKETVADILQFNKKNK